jgi:ribA/ribD-fused uncharacterized protein
MIKQFHDEYRWLSNFWRSQIEIDGELYETVEHYYQSQKSTSAEERKMIAEALTPGNAKYLGQRCQLRLDWDRVKDVVMYEGLLAKFNQHPDLMKKLLETGDQPILEGNRWRDHYWGVDLDNTHVGENRLGLMLMRIRERFKRSYNGTD